ncbi:uncharacterized protein HMPREF1541_04775 [Cyphellophora europaea CBS 101466]|uniref:tRNA dimethylallyltransferase n=1 Tax=Cyphellophora europaea (strain CBS 101466) TaxID=1220924 RepID=W2RXK1_CYPE1|nr:uncharacterized protein HMPREF1541_04775 [Cyphellophora europaea CBS 101466]ETN40498.1 hypothetical protein HMPREF1541_04775 [Cyphellophora europaea CBS 101466]
MSGSTTTLPPPAPSPRLTPLILILGATGTGKSALALSLARTLNGEILNADAMQMYRGLPVITNKLRPAEQQGIPHHLLDAIGPAETPWTVRRYVREADRVIDEVRGRGKVPIVVGGTGYYMHALVVRDGMLRDEDEAESEEGEERALESSSLGNDMGSVEEGIKRWPILGASPEEMYEELKRLDPEMARSWHPKDWRRVQRSLEICLRTGRRVSDIYREQALEREKVSSNGQVIDGGAGQGLEARGGESLLRYDPLVLWLAAEDSALKQRLNSRVGEMVTNGLFEEALELQQEEKKLGTEGTDIDKSKGIWVSIGYKEMESWAAEQLSKPQPLEDAKVSRLAQDALESVKAGTRRYAKRQERYIRMSFAKSLKQAGVSDRLLLLDGTDLSRFHSHLVPQAEGIARAFLHAKDLPEPSSLSDLAKQMFSKVRDESPQRSLRVRRHCEVCDRFLMTDKEWETHIASNSHKKVLQGRRKHQAKLEYLQRTESLEHQEELPIHKVDVPS